MNRLSSLFYTVVYWLDDKLPVQCPTCRRWQAREKMREAPHRVGGWIEICQTCYKNLYPGGSTR